MLHSSRLCEYWNFPPGFGHVPQTAWFLQQSTLRWEWNVEPRPPASPFSEAFEGEKAFADQVTRSINLSSREGSENLIKLIKPDGWLHEDNYFMVLSMQEINFNETQLILLKFSLVSRAQPHSNQESSFLSTVRQWLKSDFYWLCGTAWAGAWLHAIKISLQTMKINQQWWQQPPANWHSTWSHNAAE